MTDSRTSDRDVSRAIRSWLHEDRHEDASRLAGAVLDLVEATPRRRATWWPARRTAPMNRFLSFGLGAAAVVVLAILIGSRLLGSNVGGPGATPTPTPVPTGTSKPTATPGPTDAAGLPEGSQVVVGSGYAGKGIIVTIPAPGWYRGPGYGTLAKGSHGGADAPDGAALILFVGAHARLQQDLQQYLYVYGHPCHWSTTRPASPATTLDEALTALTSQASRDASVPVDVTVGGYAGKSIILHVPDDAVFSDCDQGEFRTLIQAFEFGVVTTPLEDARPRYAQDPGQIDRLWVFEAGLSVVIIDATYYEGTPQSVVDELVAIVESARVSNP